MAAQAFELKNTTRSIIPGTDIIKQYMAQVHLYFVQEINIPKTLRRCLSLCRPPKADKSSNSHQKKQMAGPFSIRRGRGHMLGYLTQPHSSATILKRKKERTEKAVPQRLRWDT